MVALIVIVSMALAMVLNSTANVGRYRRDISEFELGQVRYSWCLHILKNGFHFDIVEQSSPMAEQTIAFPDAARGGDYYRLELHAIPPSTDTPYHRWRERQTVLAFSNPIFVD